jgi:integrase
VKLPTGIQVRPNKHGDNLLIYFRYKGEDCREILKQRPTKSNIRYAERLRGEILNRIERKTFDYAEYFPDSQRARRFGHNPQNRTIEELLTAQLKIWEKTLQPSTVRGYRIAIDGHLIPKFGAMRVQDLSPALLREWITGLTCTAKRVRNILTPLKTVLEIAVNDDLIPFNPLAKVFVDRLLNKDTRESSFVVDPFDSVEVEAILAAASEPQHRNLFQFAFATGLRTSELIALRWSAINWDKKTAHVSEAFVEKAMKGPKTEAGIRDVELTPEAIEALEHQKEFTRLQNDRIFHNPRTMKPWVDDRQIRRQWTPILEEADVRYRNPYQTRHTFASTLLSAGRNPWWVAKQMGHKTVEMIFKHYGRWIPESRDRERTPSTDPAKAVSGSQAANG